MALWRLRAGDLTSVFLAIKWAERCPRNEGRRASLQASPPGVNEVGSTLHVSCSVWTNPDSSRELLGFHTHCKSRSVKTALWFSIILSSGNTRTELFSCEFSSGITPETGASGPEKDEPADTHPRQSRKVHSTTVFSHFLLRSFLGLRENLHTQYWSEVNQVQTTQKQRSNDIKAKRRHQNICGSGLG